MTRVAFLIPHFHAGDDAASPHGSRRPGARRQRRDALDRVIYQIHALFGPTHYALTTLAPSHAPDGTPRIVAYNAPNPYRLDVEIRIFTTGGRHLLDELRCTPSLYRHEMTQADPPFLGFECARWLRDNYARFDHICYLEDDIVIRDPLFFEKIRRFNEVHDAAGRGLLLQPQRYEESLAAGDPEDIARLHRLYIDYQSMRAPLFDGPPLILEGFGPPARLEPALNPHAGCYVVSQAQAARMVADIEFLDPTQIYLTPMDTAATAFVARALKVYKPAKDSLSFLEVQHGHQSVLRPRPD